MIMIKKFFQASTKSQSLDWGLLILRVALGLGMACMGWYKFQNFDAMAGGEFWSKQVNFLGMGGKITLGLVIFAELVCAILLLIGFLTRPALLVLIICMGYAWLITHKGSIFTYEKSIATEGKMVLSGIESAFMYLVAYVGLLFTGPGKFSLDKLVFK
jgi:putative oxidoreductase